MPRIVLMVAFVSMLAPDAGQPKRMCGRVVAVNCAGPLSPMTLRVARDPERFFEVTMPAGSREALGADADTPARYPGTALRARIEGRVEMRAVVNADGTVSDVVLVKRLFPDLDGAAVNATRQWLFSPATLDGTPVPIAVRLELTFSLR